MKIDSYSFGSMTVNGEIYDKDLIVFPDKVRPNWWRKEGHTLLADDLAEVIEYKPEVLVVGTGAYGVMKIPQATRKVLKENDIEFICKNTGEAYKIFNEYIKEGKRVTGAFHLTC